MWVLLILLMCSFTLCCLSSLKPFMFVVVPVVSTSTWRADDQSKMILFVWSFLKICLQKLDLD